MPLACADMQTQIIYIYIRSISEIYLYLRYISDNLNAIQLSHSCQSCRLAVSVACLGQTAKLWFHHSQCGDTGSTCVGLGPFQAMLKPVACLQVCTSTECESSTNDNGSSQCRWGHARQASWDVAELLGAHGMGTSNNLGANQSFASEQTGHL